MFFVRISYFDNVYVITIPVFDDKQTIQAIACKVRVRVKLGKIITPKERATTYGNKFLCLIFLMYFN